MGNSNSHLVHPAQTPKSLKGLQRHSLKNAEEYLTRENDKESKNVDRLRMMPNIQTISSAPFILDNIDQSSDNASTEKNLQVLALDDREINIPLADHIPALPHSINTILKEETNINGSSGPSCDTKSPAIVTIDAPNSIPRSGSSRSELIGTPITKKPAVTLKPITPLLEASSETSGTSNITNSASMDNRFESLVDSNAPSYGSVDVSDTESGSYMYNLSTSVGSEDFTNVDMRKETFNNRSTSDMLKLISSQDLHKQKRLLAKRRDLKKSLFKYNSCSTIYAERVFAFPGMADMLHSVSYFLEHQIHKNVYSRNLVKTEDIFSEKLNPISRHYQFYKSIPDNEVIYKYMECIFQSAELNVECAILSLIYVERLLLNTGITLHCSNWARILLGAVILASKVWDDHAIWNVDYCQIFPEMRASDLNRLERRILLGLEYNVSVRLSTYTKYYFALKDFAENFKPHNRELKALTAQDFKKLNQQQKEAHSAEHTSSQSIHPDSSSKDAMVNDLSKKLLEELENGSSKLDRSVSDNFYAPPSVPAQIL